MITNFYSSISYHFLEFTVTVERPTIQEHSIHIGDVQHIPLRDVGGLSRTCCSHRQRLTRPTPWCRRWKMPHPGTCFPYWWHLTRPTTPQCCRWLKESALWNMLSMSVTFDTSHFQMSTLNDFAPQKMMSISATIDTSHFEISARVQKIMHGTK